MSVDDTVLETSKNDLEIELHNLKIKQRKILELIDNINSITMEDDLSNPDNPSKKLPIDKGTGLKISVPQRQAVYDKILTDKTELGL